MRNKYSIFVIASILVSMNIYGQSGGIFTVTQSVVAAGGGQNSGGGRFSLDGTAGQSLAGESSGGGIFNIRGGFWIPGGAVTAAQVSLGGRVRTVQGGGIRNVIVTLTDSSGAFRTTQTGVFGYFKFENVEVGSTYIISVSGRRYAFTQPTQVRTVQEEIADLEFIAADQ